MRNYLILILLATALLLDSCKGYQPGPKDSEDLIITRITDIYLLDKNTNENLVGKINKRFDKDSIKAYRLNGGIKESIGIIGTDSLKNNFIRFIYLFNFAFEKTDIIKYSIDNKIYLYLNKDDTDTLSIYKKVNQSIKIYYNDQFLDSIPPLDEKVKVFKLAK